MSTSLGTRIWMEWMDLLRGAASPAGAALYLVFGGLLAVAVPWRLGFGFLQARIFLIYACMSLFFVAPAIAESLASDAARSVLANRRGGTGHDRDILAAKITVAALFGWVCSLVILLAALGTFNALNWAGRLLLPPYTVLAGTALLSLAFAVFVASAGAWVALRVDSAAIAKQIVRTGILVLLLLVVLGERLLPAAWRLGLEAGLSAARLPVLMVLLSALLVAGCVPFWRAALARLQRLRSA